MAGNMTKVQALDWLVKYGAVTRGYPEEPAAAYLRLGVERFREDVAAGRLPPPERHGKRLVWDKTASRSSYEQVGGQYERFECARVRFWGQPSFVDASQYRPQRTI
jgi:hypothetical protein